jgi:hypothetical protein
MILAAVDHCERRRTALPPAGCGVQLDDRLGHRGGSIPGDVVAQYEASHPEPRMPARAGTAMFWLASPCREVMPCCHWMIA